MRRFLRYAAVSMIGATLAGSASATTIDEYLKMDRAAQYKLFRQVVEIRMDQLKKHDVQAAQQLTDFYLGGQTELKDAPGYHEFKVNIDAIRHPEISGSKFDPHTTQVEGLLTQIIRNDFHDLLEKKNPPN